jgi:mannosyltransferase OCH1-like enzyme
MDHESRSAEASFFGGDHSLSSRLPILRREIRRGVWSSRLQEDEWINALLSNNLRDYDTRCIGSEDRNISQDDAANNIPNTEIPKTIHFVWLGGDDIPSFSFLGVISSRDDAHKNIINFSGEDRKDPIGIISEEGRHNFQWNECMQSWKRYHPSSRGWITHLWTEEDIIDDTHDADGNQSDGEKKDGKQCNPAFQLNISELRNAQGYHQAIKHRKYGMASDVLRLEILNKFGGMYVDIDYWCVGSLDDIIANTNNGNNNTTKQSSTRFNSLIQLFCGASNTGCIELNNGIVACRKGGHPILWNMMDSIHKYFEDISSASVVTSCQQQDSIASLLSSFLDSTTASALEKSQSTKDDDMEVIEHTGPGLLTRSVCRWLVGNSATQAAEDDSVDDQNLSYDVSQVIVFPSCIFHPFPNHLRTMFRPRNIDSQADDECRNNPDSPIYDALSMLKMFADSEETKAIHLWGCSWQDN